MVKEPVSEQSIAGTRCINSLPAEILTEIFVLVYTMHPCPWSGVDFIPRRKLRSIPVTISHVCSFWRRLAINVGYLWTHIDLVPDRIEPGTETYLARAGEKPLDVHICSDRLRPRPNNEAEDSLIKVLVAIAPLTWGLTIEMVAYPQTPPGREARIISSFLGNCVPGKLTHFSMKLDTGVRPFRDHETLVGQPEDAVEALWLPVTVLQLENYFPKSTSKAYCGLTELRLRGCPGSSISESELVIFLKSNPKLRVLQIRINIKDITPSHVQVTPVFLEDLEILTPGGSLTDNFTLMRLIQPGPNPLTVSIVNPVDYRGSNELSDQYIPIEFFARSNITRMIVTSLGDYLALLNLLTLTPNIRVLALERVSGCRRVNNKDVASLFPTIDSLYVTRTRDDAYILRTPITWSLVEHVVRRHRVPKLTLWACEIGEGFLSDGVAAQDVQATVLPDEDMDPIQGWR